MKMPYDTTEPGYNNLWAVEKNNEACNRYFFSENAMKLYSTRFVSDLVSGPGGQFFVTSEQDRMSSRPRKYTVREAINGGCDIMTVGEFQEYKTAARAKAAAKAFAKKGK